jgi:DNA-binding transcriptional LysR family regulator
MITKSIDTKWLYDFLTLEACRNFSHAAEQRNISQSAFSRRIRSLELAIGVELFDRTTSPLQLTEQGKLFHSQTRSLLQQLESNLSELSGYSLRNLANIKIAAAHSLSLTVLPKLINTLTASDQHFLYNVEAIDVVEAVNTLREGKSDFILSFHDEDLLQTPFDHMKVFESELYPVCAADGSRQPLFDIYQPNAPLLNYTYTSYMGRLVNRRLAQNEAVTLQPVFVSSMSELLKSMALNKHGIAWLPRYSITEELADGRLVRLGDDRLTVAIQAYVYRMDTRLNKNAERFWQLLKKTAGAG